MNNDAFTIRGVSAAELDAQLDAFASLLLACVHDGASVGFVLPFSQDEARAFWSARILPAVKEGGLVLLGAYSEGRLAGTVQLDHNTPPNQPHRAEVRKLLVHPDARRRGLARALMCELEMRAVALRRSLLTLDTRTGDKAEPLYASLGFQTSGIIPDFCRDTLTERLDPTTIMYKPLSIVA
ncbi:MAG: GNAT family N-acetyltransferase [Beijerinckiaceae bacterium]|nr:GNAT family N-acetyltransferase [Beijerinckiaceae bacterium]